MKVRRYLLLFLLDSSFCIIYHRYLSSIIIFVFIDSTEEENNPIINASNQHLPNTAILIGWQDEESD